MCVPAMLTLVLGVPPLQPELLSLAGSNAEADVQSRDSISAFWQPQAYSKDSVGGVTTVTMHELSVRYDTSMVRDDASMVLRLVPGGSLHDDVVPLNEAWFPQGNQCCLSDDDTQCKDQVPIAAAQIDATSRHDPRCPACSWNVLMSTCVDKPSKDKSKATSSKKLSKKSSNLWRGAFETAVCVPTWYGDMFERGVSAYFMDWLAHYKAIGASRAYIHAEGPEPEWLPGAIASRGPSSLLEVVWVHLEPIGTVQNLWYHGQMWALNDCPKRAHADGFPWVLSLDADEMLTFVDPSLTIPAYLHGLGSSIGDFDAVLFESVVTPLTRKCHSAEDYSCAVMEHTAPDSHPKHLVSTARVLVLNIHFISEYGLEGEEPGAGAACISDDSSASEKHAEGKRRENGTIAGVERRHCKLHRELPTTAWMRHMKGHAEVAGGELCASCVVRHKAS